MTLTDFLLARIADEGDMIRSARGTPARTGWQWWTNLKDTVNGAPTGPRGSIEMAPARALAECDAKRRIVELARDYWPELEHGDAAEWAFARVLRLLALPYADHMDYDEAWRP